jgi:phosphoglucosamine mutase
VRYSGTEPLVRVMTEGEDATQIRRVAEEVAEAVRAHLS